MSSCRSTRRATGQLRTLDQSPLEHALRRSRRVAGESPESGPYYPPPRRSPRRHVTERHDASPESLSHPPPPSSPFTFEQPHPLVPEPGFTSARPSIADVLYLQTQPPRLDQPLHVIMAQPHPLPPQLSPHAALPCPVEPDASPETHPQTLPTHIKVEEVPPAKDVKPECQVCFDANGAPVVQPCRHCTLSYCADCLRRMFLSATRDSDCMPPRCCAILPITIALDFLSTIEADEYRLKFEEWLSVRKTYCPVPKCSRFIPDGAVLLPPPTNAINLWGLIKQELPAILIRLKHAPCSRFFRGPTDPAHIKVEDWKLPKRHMLWLNDIYAKSPRYANIDEFTTDFNRLVNSVRSMPAHFPLALSAEEMRKRLWQEISSIRSRPNSCHIGICPSCKQVAHFGEPCDTTAQDHELAMLKTYGYKKCPRCGHGVKKMYGCRHMQCRCGAHWCWGCLSPIDQCDGGCTPPDPDSEDGEDYNDDEVETPPAGPLLQEAQSTDEAVPAAVLTSPAITAPADNTSNVRMEAVAPAAFTERPVNLDAGGRRVWENNGAFFGEEPDDERHAPIWSCLHEFRPAKLPDHAYSRGVPLGTECFRCFSRTYATIQKTNVNSSSRSPSPPDRYKHTATGDVAWECDKCDMSLCGICKNDVMAERGI
ncbi:hypothetical protein E4T38_05491 [Aureobasidium subglaciale]|nr:hypothetical protein E4T38_05491 [Aureobasidium subglaciale]KAI5221594.1 hypothetical protein E4T40_05374 [Aureobasidium subglaciale]KAI5225578.1 hypothetical protein E4T41_05243 [Aureobasidium subglaciale]KAI5261464.1 hypothetical protein E4T46_05085 [Aureobasidium subglaciale]